MVGFVAVGDVVEGLTDVPTDPVDPVEPVELLDPPCAWATAAVNSAAVRMAAVLIKRISFRITENSNIKRR